MEKLDFSPQGLLDLADALTQWLQLYAYYDGRSLALEADNALGMARETAVLLAEQLR